uniref:ascorbate ferrireductase (transmembrane) n=1 Tax=Anopheles culicifacies TaxID=139723 RepID=A0A182LYZ4_9DIPT
MDQQTYHRVYMMASWTLTCAAIICIFIDLEGFEAHAHSIVGLATFALVFVQPILGLMRPPQQQAQSAIRILHSLLGHAAYILAVTNMFLGVGLESAHISSEMYGLVGGALGVHVLAHIAFNVLEYLTSRKGSELDVNKDASAMFHHREKVVVDLRDKNAVINDKLSLSLTIYAPRLFTGSRLSSCAS